MEREQTGDEKLDGTVEKMRADVNEMQVRVEELGSRIEKTRGDWHSKQQDAGVPGAQLPRKTQTNSASQRTRARRRTRQRVDADRNGR